MVRHTGPNCAVSFPSLRYLHQCQRRKNNKKIKINTKEERIMRRRFLDHLIKSGPNVGNFFSCTGALGIGPDRTEPDRIGKDRTGKDRTGN